MKITDLLNGLGMIALAIFIGVAMVLAVTEQPTWQPNPTTGIPTEVHAR